MTLACLTRVNDGITVLFHLGSLLRDAQIRDVQSDLLSTSPLPEISSDLGGSEESHLVVIHRPNCDIYHVYPMRNKCLKLIALNILKYLPEDILREEPDFSAINTCTSGVNITDFGSSSECENQF
ncbi:6234_t:CDS:2 [Ambispora gerdemannii]|uniref:6234_t:CDS:1 n=1 Tax=Ambispora gerdemannii TaxID=144530 RepID=A0A9N9FIV0_9GLOM|nr:6234_t:CDS:2 [Ambispora gerdemannii]